MLTQEEINVYAPPSLVDLFEGHDGLPVHKFPHHIEVYEKLFRPLTGGRDLTLLEIGISHGGSLELWRKYFGRAATIIGMDIQDMTALEKRVDAKIFVGDQGNRDLWQFLGNQFKPLSIVIDDGSHKSADQILTFGELFPLLEDGGLYIVEDIHTSYRKEYGGGLYHPASFVEYLKRVIDVIHRSEHTDEKEALKNAGQCDIFSLQIYPNLAVIEKRNPSRWGGSTMRPVEYAH